MRIRIRPIFSRVRSNAILGSLQPVIVQSDWLRLEREELSQGRSFHKTVMIVLNRNSIEAWTWAILLFAIAGKPSVRALDPQDFAVELTASVSSSPPEIRIAWPANAFASKYVVSRKLAEEQAWTQLAVLPGNSRGYTDTRIVLGGTYEYEVSSTLSDGLAAYGYIYAGVEAPLLSDRGRVVLIVDAAVAPALQTEVAVLMEDLVGDGWIVLRHDVARSASPSEVRALIRNDYQNDPERTKAVFLLGHVPVPYSGNINPDLHLNHTGAWPADGFYGDMSSAWTDKVINNNSAEDARNHNVPNDGKFDQSSFSAPVVLQVGRVDLVDLPAFAPKSELDLLRQYLEKNHKFRHGQITAERRALIRDNFGEINGDAPATDAWRTFAPFFGIENIHPTGPGNFFPTLNSGSFLWAYGGGGGEYYQADGVGSTRDFSQQTPKCPFFMLDGSYFGDWDSTDNFLRAALASPGYGLAAAWTGLPHWFLHHMALGQTIGFSTLITQNNESLYKNQVNLGAHQVHIALMGDPTLRMHVVAPVSNLKATAAPGGPISLKWTASSEANKGYYVFRSSSPSGPFARLTRTFITQSSYADSSPPPGPKVYMVRAIKLESTPSGTYYNASQGIFATVDSAGGETLPVVTIQAANPTAQESPASEGAFVINRSGAENTELSVDFAVSGTAANGLDYDLIASTIIIPQNAASVWIPIKPISDSLIEGNETVELALLPKSTYTIGPSSAATVLIEDAAINAPPVISSIPPQTTSMNTPTPSIPFSVSDPDSDPSNLTVTVESSNIPLVPLENVEILGTGSERSVVLTPALDQSGTVTISLVVSDRLAEARTSFDLTVLKPTVTRIESVTRQFDGTVLRFEGNTGGKFTVQSSDDLVNWTTLGNGTFLSADAIEFVDTGGMTNGWRFYRISTGF